MKFFPVHPVAMRTTFSTCALVNFAVDPDALRRRLPAHLTPDLHEGRAFVSIVIARMERMRPAFLPQWLGVTYHQVVYRAVVRCGSERGVTFLRSDADNRFMTAAGNALTFFRFHHARISCQATSGGFSFALRPADGAAASIEANFDASTAVQTKPSKHFDDLASAQAFLSELYLAFGQRRSDGRVEVVRIERNEWASQAIGDQDGRYAAMTSGALFARSEVQLDSIFLVRDLRYRWEPLSLERLVAPAA